MGAPRQFAWPNALIGGGMAPLAIWTLALIWALRPHSNIGERIFIVLAAGPVAYILTMVLCGSGLIWADHIIRRSNVEKPRATQTLVKIAAVLLLLPWVVLPVIGVIWSGK